VTHSSVDPIDPATLPRDDPPLDQRWPTADLDRAAELASKSLGSSFELDGSAYDG
jgi:hypothetical protein